MSVTRTHTPAATKRPTNGILWERFTLRMLLAMFVAALAVVLWLPVAEADREGLAPLVGFLAAGVSLNVVGVARDLIAEAKEPR